MHHHGVLARRPFRRPEPRIGEEAAVEVPDREGGVGAVLAEEREQALAVALLVHAVERGVALDGAVVRERARHGSSGGSPW